MSTVGKSWVKMYYSFFRNKFLLIVTKLDVFISKQKSFQIHLSFLLNPDLNFKIMLMSPLNSFSENQKALLDSIESK